MFAILTYLEKLKRHDTNTSINMFIVIKLTFLNYFSEKWSRLIKNDSLLKLIIINVTA